MKCDKKIFADILDKHKGLIHKVSMLYTNNQSDKEDLFQDICYQICKSLNKYRNEAQLSTWLYRVAINTAISQVRKKRDVVFFDDTHLPLQSTTNNYEKNEETKLLFKAISLLNKIDKAIILLWLEEKKYEEIAEILGISKSNVSVKLVRIKLTLIEKIKKLEK